MARSNKARRSTWNQNQTPESSESGYGQEILPTIDLDALAQLPPHEQDGFREMRMKDRLRVLARWKKEGRPSPRTGNSPTNDSTVQLMRTSSAPQLPELQMDVPTSTFADAANSSEVDLSADVEIPAIQAGAETLEHVDTNETLPTPHRDLGFTPSLLSLRSKRSQAELYMDETPEKRCLRKLHRDQVALESIANEQDREWCRFRGVGAVPPGLGLSAHSPSTADRVIARTITRNHAVVQETGHQPDAYGRSKRLNEITTGLLMSCHPDTLGIAQDVDEKERALRAANGSPDLRGPLFVRTRTASVAQPKPKKLVSRKKSRPMHVGGSPPPGENGVGPGHRRNGLEDNKLESPEGLHEQMDGIRIGPGPVKLVGQKIEASKNWIKNVFKGKTERKKKARVSGRPLSRAHVRDEAQVGIAKRVSVMPVKAPQPSRPSFFVERPPPVRRPSSSRRSEQPRPSLQSAAEDKGINLSIPARLVNNAFAIMQAPVVVMNTGQSGDRQTGRKAQLSNITAAKTVADIIRSCLGPNAMLKMLLDPMGGIALTNDGHAILREIEVAHPAAKNMIELSRTQDEEVGDGTTTVIILAGEILAQALPQLERNIHPVVIISAFKRALNDALSIVEKVSTPVNTNDDQAMYRLISSAIDTKYAARWSQMMCAIALKAVRTVSHDAGGGKKEVDIKRYAKVEKVPGGQIEDSKVLDGVMLNKDITHPKMRRRIENPRVVLLDCPLEYKKGESQTNIEISKEEDWNRILQIEEEQVKIMADAIVALKPDVVITEKGVSDLAQHFMVKHNITALRRVRKTDNNRIARATGATIVNRVEDLRESDVGTQCGLFEIEKIGDEYFTFITKCRGPKACTILLRGPSKDILNEIERNLQDAMFVARNVVFRPRLSPGGGATEMAVSVRLGQLAKEVEGVQQWPYKAVAEAMEVIPRTLVQNSGSSPIRVLTKLRAKHAEGQHTWGIDGHNGTLVDMRQYGTWEPEAVKLQSIKTAIEAACLLLRVDDICSAKSAKTSGGNMGETED
ncbi:MAG: hypothetical protein Q9168_006329, partial [Polycauliona sp. 1 TL-2023]